MTNQYISGLLNLRRELDNIIDNEVENTMRGRGNHSKLRESLEYKLEDSSVLSGRYKEFEK